MALLYGPDAAPLIAKWACERLDNVELPGGFEAIGITDADDQKLVGAVLYTDYRPNVKTVEMWAVGEGNWLTRQKIRELFAYPFEVLGCNRITLRIARPNKKARAFVRKLGFVEEGNAREALGPGKDLILYGMLKRECRWLGDKHG